MQLRGAAAAAGRRRVGSGVAAFYGGSPVSNAPSSTYLDSGSAKKRRSRRLFEAGQLHDVLEHAEHQVCGAELRLYCCRQDIGT